MTNLEAFKSMIEFAYSNDNLFNKILTDQGVTGSDTYNGTSSEIKDLDLCLADLYFYLATHPDLGEGRFSIKWSADQLLKARREIYAKHGLRTPENANRPVTIDGTRIW